MQRDTLDRVLTWKHMEVPMIWKILAAAAFCYLAGCGGGSSAQVQPTPTVQQTKPLSNVAAFMGDSITQYWNLADFDTSPTLNFGVVGETTTQMLARFQSEVIANAPGVVVILGGINDILLYDAGTVTTAPSIDSIAAMAAMAKAAGIKVILCSLTPFHPSSTTGAVLTAPTVIEDLNQQLIALAQANGYLYADYYDEMLAPDGTQNGALFVDAVHPNAAGYAVMWKVIEPLLQEDLQ